MEFLVKWHAMAKHNVQKIFQPYQSILIFLYFLCYFGNMADVILTLNQLMSKLFVENFEFQFEIVQRELESQTASRHSSKLSGYILQEYPNIVSIKKVVRGHSESVNSFQKLNWKKGITNLLLHCIPSHTVTLTNGTTKLGFFVPLPGIFLYPVGF